MLPVQTPLTSVENVSRRDPRLCFVGPTLGQDSNRVLSQGDILANLFAREGYSVRLVSTTPNRVLRLANTVRSLVGWRKETDVIMLMVFSGLAFVLADVASLVVQHLHKPLVLWLHGGNLPDLTERHPRWVQRVLRRGDALVSPSDYLADSFRGWGFDVEVIPNVLAIEHYPYRQRQKVQPRLLWMRAFHEVYHPEMAVEVLAGLQKTRPDATLTMAGRDKGSLARVKRAVKRKGLNGTVRFAGFLDMAGKQREFGNHDIFLNTNRVDNMPVSVVEAAAFGLPVVSTAVGGILYLLQHEETGLLVKDGDVAGMVDAVWRLFREPDLAARLSANGRRLAEACAWPQVKTQWEALFEQVVNRA
jgi:glycosyltransferase involved in cell wall biosynthesis